MSFGAVVPGFGLLVESELSGSILPGYGPFLQTLDGSTSIPCAVGNATSAGIFAGIESGSPVTISCDPGEATGNGVAATVTNPQLVVTAFILPGYGPLIETYTGGGIVPGVSRVVLETQVEQVATVINCEVASGQGAGIKAELLINGGLAIDCAVGGGAGAGVLASIQTGSGTTINCSVGYACPVGADASIEGSGPSTINCAVGAALGHGISAVIDADGDVIIHCSLGTSTSSGVIAQIVATDPPVATLIDDGGGGPDAAIGFSKDRSGWRKPQWVRDREAKALATKVADASAKKHIESAATNQPSPRAVEPAMIARPVSSVQMTIEPPALPTEIPKGGLVRVGKRSVDEEIAVARGSRQPLVDRKTDIDDEKISRMRRQQREMEEIMTFLMMAE